MFRQCKKIHPLWILAFHLLLVINCEIDHGIGPLKSSISGTIHYEGEWPASTAEIAIVASTSFPPKTLSDLILSEPLPIGGSEYRYHFYVPPGTYRFIGIAWREENAPWDISNVVGKYLDEETGQPDSLTVATDASEVTGIDMVVDFSRGTIAGTVTFLGAWPDSTEEVRVAVYATYPPANFFDISSYSNPFSLGVVIHSYTVSLLPGTYEWIMVVWRKQGTFWGPEGFLGMYYAPSDSTRPGAVLVKQGKENAGIDITVDFAQMGVLPPELEDLLGSDSP